VRLVGFITRTLFAIYMSHQCTNVSSVATGLHAFLSDYVDVQGGPYYLHSPHFTVFAYYLFRKQIISSNYFIFFFAVPEWLRCSATNRKVAGSITASVSGFFIDITKFFQSHYGPGVDSASNRNEYEEYFLGVKAAGV